MENRGGNGEKYGSKDIKEFQIVTLTIFAEKKQICTENGKIKNLKTSRNPKFNFLLRDALQNAKFLILWLIRFFPRRD